MWCLVSGAREAGVDVDRLVKLPMVSNDRKKDESVQANLPCPECVSLEKSLSDDMLDDFSFSASEMEGDFNASQD